VLEQRRVKKNDAQAWRYSSPIWAGVFGIDCPEGWVVMGGGPCCEYWWVGYVGGGGCIGGCMWFTSWALLYSDMVDRWKDGQAGPMLYINLGSAITDSR
jgi:hypothetical protein